ncbi:LAQU0S02e05974g1_1 [Lachancea quebecensis]|uniref:Mitochondrial import inner membrane translocase subunit TIM54 n=1 Tax=Lachancea quebecensis TaxID=1654605 RepID=A0A0P1KQL5_9SACH|nr:LAQU0S02e05974g1_1 [Lachancea quebecensis]
MPSSENPASLQDGPKVLKKPGYSNPAFKAMGIPSLRLPSRNWMIFWTVLTVSVSGIVYDKQQQKKIVKKWCETVQPLSEEKFPVNEVPRKVTVFVAPPPSDYLDTSMSVWRRFIKPVLYSSGVDYEVFTEEKQGPIRAEVAERIRELRRELIKHEEELKHLEDERKIWSRCKRVLSSKFKHTRSSEELDQEMEKVAAEKFKAEFDYKNLLGVYYKSKNRSSKVVAEDALVSNPEMAGGVICIGRGAYKEYIEGVHEGILGPLEPATTTSTRTEADLEETPALPETLSEVVQTEEIDKNSNEGSENSTPGAEAVPPPHENTEDENLKDANVDPETPAKPKPVPKPYISPKDYQSADLPQEFSSPNVVRDLGTGVPALFYQPILVIPMPNLVGFLNIPERIYRYYRKRYLAEEYCKAAASCVLQKVRPFDSTNDLNAAKTEENDWPKKWVQQGMEKDSPWVQELQGDHRVLEKLSVYDPLLIEKE